MKKYFLEYAVFIFFGVLFTPNNISAQKKGQALTDSLSFELKEYKLKCNGTCLEDSSKVILLNALAWQLKFTNPDSSILLCNQALEISEKIHWMIGVAQSHSHVGTVYEARGNYPKALGNAKEAIKIWESLLLNEKGSNRILASLASTQGNLAMLFLKTGDYTSALENFLKVNIIFEKLGIKNRVALTTGNIAIVYIRMKDFDKAIEYSKRALKMEEEQNNDAGISRNCINLGISFKELKRYDESLSCHFKALELSRKNNNNLESSKCLSNISDVYADMNNFDKALDYSFQALKIDSALNNPEGIAMREMNIGSIYIDMLRFDEALTYLKKSLLIAENIGYHELILECYKNLRVVNEQRGNYFESLQYFKKEKSLEDSVFNDGKKVELSRLEMSYEFEKKEAVTKAEQEKQIAIAEADKKRLVAEAAKKRLVAEAENKLQIAKADNKRIIAETDREKVLSETEKKIAISEADKKMKIAESEKTKSAAQADAQKQKFIRNSIIAGAAVIGLSSLFIFFFYKRKRDAEQKQKETSLSLQISETEMKALRSQMNPHFIFNALQSIQTFLLSHKSEEANAYLLKFSKLMRLVLENSQHSEVPLKEDMQALELYLQLESIRLQHPFTYQFHVDKTVDTENDSIPPLILQPFVENAIWHGLQYKPGPGHIDIYISKKSNALYATVEDNGVGRDMSKQAAQPMLIKRESLGMKLTEERLKILNELKNIKAQFKITDLFSSENKPAGTKVELSLPSG